MSKEIPLTQGMTAIVDDDDFDFLMQWKWYAKKSHSSWYACHTNNGQYPCTTQMHRLIMNAPDGYEVHHKNDNKLDNRKENLQLCTRLTHSLLHRKSGKYLGVQKSGNKWVVRITGFATEEDAARAYDSIMKILFGETTEYNFPPSK